MRVELSWNSKTTPVELRSMLKTLGEAYPIFQGRRKGMQIRFVKSQKIGLCEVKKSGRDAFVRYSSQAQAARAVGALVSGLVDDTYRETTPFTLLGIMLDCSRNAVMTVEHVKVWLRKLALLGYNMVMLYTEDTYELPGEPYFGYQRGAYTKKELKTIDAYASKLGIEMIPCIQTLGHCGKFLRHGAYGQVKDTASVMLVDEPKTYELIDKMISHWAGTLRTRRIHVGMDETHDLGRGRYLDKHGYVTGFTLFNKHLKKVVSICRKHGVKPMIWSDMYFRLGCESGSYYDESTVIPKDVIKKIPRSAQLVYWDYYTRDKSFYRDWIARHRSMGKEPIMGSGIWTWNKYWYDRLMTEAAAGPCIEACRSARVKEIFFTQWGDNGAYCDHDSAFAGMTWCADKVYGSKEPTADVLEKRFAGVCGGSYLGHALASDVHSGVKGFNPNMWDDPFFAKHVRTFCKDSTVRIEALGNGFGQLASRLEKIRDDRSTGDLEYAYQVARTFADRYVLLAKLIGAYRKKDAATLRKMVGGIAPLRRQVKKLAKVFRRMWLSHNKPQGIETIQARFGMLDARYAEMADRIREYVSGRVKTIAEFDIKCPPRR